ncbi:manganese efflux pump [Alkalibacter rhizosphaerae]|uniref:Putative manganese efflux pump MntP n=1 Tax=Alkalibacter rhizosphaerae TaxID=2815577 RepID=A0A975AH43_9FIRM|nr:manganese efflux pump MntP family protein [Alkalibacter rhizosphaerae]QSX07613.1 manganese efflux pump [Alkalibacter rhizosphaerae]
MTPALLLSTAVALSMDAFAVAASCGVTNKARTTGTQLRIALYFGFFQAFMPLIGYVLAYGLADRIHQVTHWIAFGLLGFLGVRMMLEAKEPDKCKNEKLTNKYLLTLAVATSIDALISGVGFALLQVNILLVVAIIGIVTALLSFVGARFGQYLGFRFQWGAEIFGGAVLVLIGTKILLEGLF